MMQRFVNRKSLSRLEIERRAELMYMCEADASHTRLPRAMHRHEDCIEIVFIREGSGSHIIDGRLYQTHKGDVLIYNSGVLRDESATPYADMSVYCCAFKNLKLRGLPRNTLTQPDERVVLQSGELYPEFDQLLQMLYTRVSSEHRYAAEFCNQLLQALIVLIVSLSRDNETATQVQRFDIGQQVKNYIDEHYRETIDLKSMAQDLRISHYYLAHKFKHAVGCSPIQYLIRRRIGEAQSLLINTDLSVTEVATRVGYDNSNYFNMAFKKVVGLTPNVYRTQCVK
ncbi:AraC family transcriptional regulator [Marinobacterium sedimentorum]|uniref:AraC family transcriptional regulator n=1 Tax=Marinobacterium sedimentorum TaxID=2927804 RepID=UPI0020C61AAB|nr:AraC family transcriptional regulator [Marinobacterium sedimentorum]MCP8688407.1 AraC family transcriptional regulator [Marinobacterium sedimentorum]